MAKILLVDSTEVRRRSWQRMLTEAGHAVTSVGSVSEAISALENDKTEVVITALWPASPSGATGIDLTEAIRQRGDRPVMMYGFPDFGQKWKQKAREAGVNNIVGKFFSVADVDTMIEKLLSPTESR